MPAKTQTWKSYLFLGLSILVTLAMFLLDPVAISTNEAATGPMIGFIFFGTIAAVILGVIAFTSKEEKKVIPIIALIITFFNIFVIAFFIILGFNFAP